MTGNITDYVSSVFLCMYFGCQEDYTEPDEHEDLRVSVFQTFDIFEICLIYSAVHVKQSLFKFTDSTVPDILDQERTEICGFDCIEKLLEELLNFRDNLKTIF
ncbi:hypothetical protein E3U43_010729 [Larimichthys crocea]|uniref:Uncharacterized protein n=1 Tax=Larimichthys crocea TaxID=215358 RepID=A0ACD3RG31_LARCR|nr:hypothetical protein E3U43_010729 [Larimichthys crocea]